MSSEHGLQMEKYVGATRASQRLAGHPKSTAVTAVRLISSGLGAEMTAPIPVEDTYIVSLQIERIGRHELWKGGKLSNALPYERDSINIVHLAEEPRILLPNPFDCLQLHLTGAALKSFAEDNHDRHITGFHVTPGEINEVIANLGRALLPALARSNTASGLYVDQLIFGMLSELTTRYGDQVPARCNDVDLSPAQIRAAQEMLVSERGDVGLVDLAREFQIPLASFTTAFQAATGMSPSQWVRRYRIDLAQELLLTTQLALRDIAARCGFADQAHLTRTFSAGVGMTPSVWRRNR
ncbi:helix-turn-helix transcriptional regulator [Sinorhizobium mexicanum]|uniref:Helix-turn-helix transcriptional regulator n=1 Tax=Sinorhizobium mexicanum TaxID=375549 RepID=A0A859QSL7_9HYPH|nr:helix-turn-helix transcriptional regulator [Sinorhizobium mexicanum]MBP1881819.1 AraC-like DNA-binding protein [Sinorhizobium mexicanum]QLL61571.1 helix-turn-helix transcriptional regulator [Sinorhizobium mexicanum]